MAKAKSKSKSKARRHSTGGKAHYIHTVKQVAAVSLIGVAITMADRFREGKTLNPISKAFWTNAA